MKLRHLTIAAAIAAAAATTLTLTGCSQQQGAVVVQQTSSPSQEASMTPLQRGQVRDKALSAATAGWEAWKRNDLKGMKPYWSQRWIDYYTKVYAKWKAEDKTHIRVFKMALFDVTEMDPSGTEVIVDANFTDRSYYVVGSAKQAPVNKPGKQAQLTVDKQPDGSWKISNIITGADIME